MATESTSLHPLGKKISLQRHVAFSRERKKKKEARTFFLTTLQSGVARE